MRRSKQDLSHPLGKRPYKRSIDVGYRFAYWIFWGNIGRQPDPHAKLRMAP